MRPRLQAIGNRAVAYWQVEFEDSWFMAPDTRKEVKKWVKNNAQAKSSFSSDQAYWVLFTDKEDAMLCYLTFK